MFETEDVEAETKTAVVRTDYAIDVDVPDENIVRRMTGRRACVSCGGTYHIKYNPTKVEGVCDACGGELILRDDDKPETVEQRLRVYHEQTQPLIDYYTKEGILKEVDGTIDLEDVFFIFILLLLCCSDTDNWLFICSDLEFSPIFI